MEDQNLLATIVGSGAVGALIGAFATLGGIIVTAIVTLKVANKAERNKFRLAALDKRLEAHQEAYEMCSKLIDDLIEGILTEDRKLDARTWFNKNCLYLTKESVKVFLEFFDL